MDTTKGNRHVDLGASKTSVGSLCAMAPRVQVPNHKVSTQNHDYASQYGSPTYLVLGYFGALGPERISSS